MTDEVDPSKSGDGEALAIAQAIKQHGAVGDGWIADTNTAYYADQSGDVAGAPLNAFDHAASDTTTTPPDVTIDTGEAFIGGAWLARDTQTVVDLADNTTGQTVYVGWDASATETVIVGLDAAFAADDERIPIWTFDTASGAVTPATDERTIGKQTELGAATLDAGSEIARFLMTAASASTQGTAGDTVNELWRAGTATSDLLMNVAASGRMNLAWNAYYDGSDWKYIVGSEPAYRIAFSGGGIELLTAPSGTADAIISWNGFTIDGSGLAESDSGTQVYDDSTDTVPQSQLAGPASSLSSYPLPSGDISDGSGSGLDADTVDGKHAGDLASGRWTFINSNSDGDSTTVYDHTFTPSTTYDQYLVEMYFEPNHGSGNSEWLNIQLNNDGSSNYDTVYADDTADIATDANDKWFQKVMTTDNDRTSYGRYVIHAPKDGNTLSAPGEKYPRLYPIAQSADITKEQFLNGTFTVHTSSVTNIRVTSGASPRYAAATVWLHGRNM